MQECFSGEDLRVENEAEVEARLTSMNKEQKPVDYTVSFALPPRNRQEHIERLEQIRKSIAPVEPQTASPQSEQVHPFKPFHSMSKSFEKQANSIEVINYRIKRALREAYLASLSAVRGIFPRSGRA